MLKDLLVKMSANQIELLIKKIGKIQFIDLNQDLDEDKLTILIENNALILNEINLKKIHKKTDNYNLFLEKFTEYDIDLNNNLDGYEKYLTDIINASKSNNFNNLSKVLDKVKVTEILNLEYFYYSINNGHYVNESMEILKKSNLDWNKLDKDILESILASIDNEKNY